MKKTIIPLLAGTLLCCLHSTAKAQEYKEHISKAFTLQKDAAASTLVIYNVSGFIKVEGYAGDKIVIEADETITADDVVNTEAGKKECKLGFDEKTDSLIAYIAAPYDSRPHRNYYEGGRDIHYHFRVDYTVKVPYAMNLHIATVNNGFITVNNVTGNLHVNNVNAGIKLTGVKSTAYAHTVNGDITVEYASNPVEASSYYTVNGNIHVNYKPGLSADVQFKTMHGDLFTDFDDATVTPGTVTKKQDSNGSDKFYKLSKITSVRFGNGGKTFRFETLNGNVYIKKQS